MRFYGTPNMSVFEINKSRKDMHNVYKRRIRLFRFDDNGEFTTTDEKLIAKLIKKFKHDEPITTIEEKPVEAEEVAKVYHCKHVDCDFVAHSPIELAQHSRKIHPKGGD